MQFPNREPTSDQLRHRNVGHVTEENGSRPIESSESGQQGEFQKDRSKSTVLWAKNNRGEIEVLDIDDKLDLKEKLDIDSLETSEEIETLEFFKDDSFESPEVTTESSNEKREESLPKPEEVIIESVNEKDEWETVQECHYRGSALKGAESHVREYSRPEVQKEPDFKGVNVRLVHSPTAIIEQPHIRNSQSSKDTKMSISTADVSTAPCPCGFPDIQHQLNYEHGKECDFFGPGEVEVSSCEKTELLDRTDSTTSDASTDTVCQTFVKEWKLMAHSSLPEWLKDNDYLHSSHRPPLPCFATCFKSVFSIHSETVNIWTHLIGSVVMLGIMCYFYIHPDVSTYTWQRKLVFSVFFCAAALCLTFSWVYHTVYCHSSQMNNLFCKLDYSGIAVLILGSFVPWLYYGFYCDDTNMIMYIAAMSVLSILCIVVSLMNRFGTPVFRPIRAAVFVGLGLSGVIPFLHVLSNIGFSESVVKVSSLQMFVVAFLYIAGATIYALRIPERFFPGKVDIVGHSHQVFHILVVAAAIIHYVGIKDMADHRSLIGECNA